MLNLPIEIQTMIFLSNPEKSTIEKENYIENLPKDFNWEFFEERTCKTNLTGFVLSNEASIINMIPIKILEVLKNYQNRILVHNLKLFDELRAIVTELESQKIKYAILKGWDVIVRGNSTIKQRQISDIDILIDPSDEKKALQVFEDNGFRLKQTPSKSNLHKKLNDSHAPIQGYKNGLSLDIHYSLFALNSGFKTNNHELLESVEIVNFKGLAIKLLDESSASLFAILHTYKHLFGDINYKVASLQDFYSYKVSNLNYKAMTWHALNAYVETIDLFGDYNKSHLKNTKLNKIFYEHITGRTIRNSIKVKPFRNRLRVTIYSMFKQLKTNPILIYGYIFPQKAYLNSFGEGSYFNLWFRRFFRLFSNK
jgi:predicted nucleotidyltransferase